MGKLRVSFGAYKMLDATKPKSENDNKWKIMNNNIGGGKTMEDVGILNEATGEISRANMETGVELFRGIAMERFDKAATDILMSPTNPGLVKIRPDGIVYIEQVEYRRALAKAFGVGGWALLDRHIGISDDGSMVNYQGSLFVQGRFVSSAVGGHKYQANGGGDYASSAEAAKSDCLTRCCKDLLLFSELWDKDWVTAWQKTYAAEVWCVNVGSKADEKGKKKKFWRLKADTPYSAYPWREDGGGDYSDLRESAQHGQLAREIAPDDGHLTNGEASGEQRQYKAAGPTDTACISVKQAGRFKAISMAAGWSREQSRQLLADYGYTVAEEIQKKDYDTICSKAERGVTSESKKGRPLMTKDLYDIAYQAGLMDENLTDCQE